MSRGKKLSRTSLFTLIVLIAVGQFPHHAGTERVEDPSPATWRRRLPTTRRGSRRSHSHRWPIQVGHLGISINFVWLLITGFLVLFMQVGFAFLVTGLT